MFAPRPRFSTILLAISRGASALVSVCIMCATVPPSSVFAQRTMTAHKSVTIGADANDDLQLTNISAIVADRAHNVYVAQEAAAQVWKFDANGKLITKLGRKGGGPGEFNRVSGIGFIGDTLWVADQAQNRITLFHGDKVAATFPSQTGLLRSSPVAVLQNRAQMLSTYEKDEKGDVVRGTLVIARDGIADKSVQSLDVKNRDATIRFPDGMMSVYQPYSDADIIAPSPSADIVYVISRPIPAVATAARYTITSYAPTGAKLKTTSLQYTPEPYAKADYEKTIGDYVEAFKNTPLFKMYPKEAPAAFRSAVPQPKFAPVWSRAVVSSDGQLWLKPFMMPNDTVSWSVFDRQGALVAHARLPKAFIVQAVSGDALWGYELGEDDETHLVKYVVDGK